MQGLRGTLIFAASWLTATAVFAQPVHEARYYLLIYGAQTAPLRVEQTHTWATFVKTERAGAGDERVQADTISWMPASLRIRPWALRSEPGVNLTQAQTLDWVKSVGARISMLGPYEIDRERYELLVARKSELENGSIAYRASGGLTRKAAVSNCGQSFTRADPVPGGLFQPTPEPGERGAVRLAARYVRTGAFIQPQLTHDWLLPVLGVEPGSVVRREPAGLFGAMGQSILRGGRRLLD